MKSKPCVAEVCHTVVGCRCETCAQSLTPSRETVETVAAQLQRQDRWQAHEEKDLRDRPKKRNPSDTHSGIAQTVCT